MASDAQRAANRRNALRSTGPRTAAGKAASSRNALAHGVWTDRPVVPGEDPAAWDAHRAGILASLAPVGLLEERLAERVALLFWRLDRLARYETLATAADLADAALPAPVGWEQLGGVAAGQATPAGRAAADARRRLAAAREERAGRRAALAAVLALAGGPDDRPVPAGVAATILSAAWAAATLASAGAALPDPGRPLLARIGRAEPEVAAVAWTAGLVWRAVAVYAAAAGVPEGELAGRVAARLEADGRRLAGQVKRLKRYLDGVAERRRQEGRWAVARQLLPADGRGERLVRYEAHLHKLLTATLHELERLQAARAGRPVAPPVAVDVTVVAGAAG